MSTSRDWWTVKDWATADAYLRKGRDKVSRPAGNKTRLERSVPITAFDVDTADISVRLHATKVVTYHHDGTATLNTGGWDTNTTWQRMRSFVPNVRIYSWQAHRKVGTLKCVFHPSDPLTAPRVSKCRDCSGTGRHVYTTGGRCDGFYNPDTRRWEYDDEPTPIVEHDDPCDRCNGTGQRDYGSRPDPLVFEDGMRVRVDTGEVVDKVHHERASALVARELAAIKVREVVEKERERRRPFVMRANAINHAWAMRSRVRVADGTETFYKGVGPDFQSPVQTRDRLTYVPGTLVEAPSVNLDPFAGCAEGVNFCTNIASAASYGGLVVALSLPKGEEYVDAGDKLRAKRVIVGAVVRRPR